MQSITIDEADTYLVWVARHDPSHWQGASNNHILNSLLMRLFTSVFGVSHLSVRAPALLGAALYIGAAYLLCRKLTPDLRVQWPVFVCLVYNPFVFDHLVAARGYALALGFLMCMLAAAVYMRLDVPACAVCSVCAALSFAANFAFAFVNIFAMLAILTWACALTQATRARVRILGACVLPGLLVSVFLSVPAVLHWPKGQLDYGAHSLREMFSTVARASLYRLNPQIVNPMLYRLAGIREAVSVAGAAGAGGVAVGEAAAGRLPGAARHPGGHDGRALAAAEMVPRAAADGSYGDLDCAPVCAGDRSGRFRTGARSP